MNELERRDALAIVEAAPRGAAALIPTLLALQERLGFLPEEALRAVREHTGVSAAGLAEVLSFYPRFRTRPVGRHLVQVCTGTACHLRGAGDTLAELRHQLGLGEGEDTDAQGLFTVEAAACLGCCTLAPVVRIGRHTYGHVDAARVPELLAEHLATAARERDSGAPAASEAAAAPIAGELRLCRCTSCSSAGAEDLDRALRREIAALSLPVVVRGVGCTGRAWDAPLVELVPRDGPRQSYARVRPEQARSLLLEGFAQHSGRARAAAVATRLLDRLLTGGEDPLAGLEPRVGASEAHQRRRSTAHAGALDPLDLDAYLAHGGFEALRRAAEAPSPEAVIAWIDAAGLRGRGGAGYPAAAKWRATRAAPGGPRVVVCNGDEGDAGAFMDRMLLESFPFRVLEGMAIAALAVGASQAWLYLRGSYRQAIARVREAIAGCEARGIFDALPAAGAGPLDVRVFEGAGAYVCGEETALLEAMEGRRGVPRLRPPWPSERGLEGRPTLVSNVETFALVPGIVLEGPEAFASLGTPASKGTKTFALAGRVVRGGLVEVPMGTSLRRIVEEIGGGVPEGGRLRAVQVGGPSGGCIPAALADVPVDYEALRELGAIMGSGGMIALDEGDCVVDLARYFSAFARWESCGKCSACRVGTVRLHEALEAICAGRGSPAHLDLIEELGAHMASASRCGLGRAAPNTALSTLRHFREDYQAHLEGRCPAGRCKEMIRYSIAEGCIGCTRCAQRCPADAIQARPHQRHSIDAEACTRCDVCRQACPVGAVEVA